MDATTSNLPFFEPSRREPVDRLSVLTAADIREFQQIVRASCGVDLDDVTAWHRATALVAMYRMLLKPIPEDPEVSLRPNVVPLSRFEPGKVS